MPPKEFFSGGAREIFFAPYIENPQLKTPEIPTCGDIVEAKDFECVKNGRWNTIVADSLEILDTDDVRLESHSEDCIPMRMSQQSFEFLCKDANFVELFKNTPYARANEWLETIKGKVKDFYVTNPPRNRKERRARAKRIEEDIRRFKSFCKKHRIEIKTS